MPKIHTLTPEHARELLARNHVARLAYSLHDRVSIEPIHYVFHEDSLYVRTSYGAKLKDLRHNPYVALEVDEIASLFDWKSVVVRGFVELLSSENNQKRHAEGVEQLRRLIPEALTHGDPTPHRTVILRIHASEIDGRESKT